MRLGALILAAGAATRMGSIKQLLPFGGRTLVEHTIQQAEHAQFSPVIVVLGAQAEAVGEAVARTSASWIVNEEWRTGMGSSLHRGLEKMLEVAPDIEGLAVLLADQPLIRADHLQQMRQAFMKNGSQKHATPAHHILAAHFAGTLGAPAFFDASLFGKLRELPHDAGARALLRGEIAQVQAFELPEAATDIDTPGDFAALQ